MVLGISVWNRIMDTLFGSLRNSIFNKAKKFLRYFAKIISMTEIFENPNVQQS